MIIGIGSDLCNIERIENSLSRFGDRFLNRVFTEVERKKAASRPHTIAGTLAKRFAAKEAFSKAIGLGIHMPMTWSRVQILNRRGGAPEIRLADPLADWYDARFGVAHVSVTDDSDIVAAFVVVEARPVL